MRLLRSKEQFIHLHGSQTHEVLKNSRPLRIKFPQTEGATFAGQKAPNQHNLCHYDQINLPFLEALNLVLQQGYVFGRPPVKPLVDP